MKRKVTCPRSSRPRSWQRRRRRSPRPATSASKVLGYEWSGEKQSMDPADMHSGDDAYHIFAVYNRLVDVDDNFKVLPELATEWSVGDDGLTWTFHLREGVKFHDGSDFDANDVVYTFQRFWDPELASGAPAVLHFLKPENVKAVDPRTVTFTTEDPVAEFPVLITNKFTNIVAEGAKHDDLRLHGNGTGPFMQEQFEPNAPVRILRKNPNYWDEGLPKEECLRVTVAQEPIAAVSAIKAGEVDLVLNVDPSLIPSLQDDPNVELLETGASNSMTVSMWVDTPPFDDVRVRQALKLVVDRQAMIDTVLLGFGEPGADNPVPLSSPASYVQRAAANRYRESQAAAGRGRPRGRAEARPVHCRGRARDGAHGAGVRRAGQARGLRHQRHRHPGRQLLGRHLAEAAVPDLGLVDAPARRGARGRLHAGRQVEGDPLGAARVRRAAAQGQYHRRPGGAEQALPGGRAHARRGGRRDHPDVRPPGAGDAQGLLGLRAARAELQSELRDCLQK